jgi:hypothetical protein
MYYTDEPHRLIVELIKDHCDCTPTPEHQDVILQRLDSAQMEYPATSRPSKHSGAARRID